VPRHETCALIGLIPAYIFPAAFKTVMFCKWINDVILSHSQLVLRMILLPNFLPFSTHGKLHWLLAWITKSRTHNTRVIYKNN